MFISKDKYERSLRKSGTQNQKEQQILELFIDKMKQSNNYQNFEQHFQEIVSLNTSQSQRQSLINAIKSNDEIKCIKILTKLRQQSQNYILSQSAFQIIGGGGCVHTKLIVNNPIEQKSQIIQQNLKKMEGKKLKRAEINKDFKESYQKYINDEQKKFTIENEYEIAEMHTIFTDCMSSNKIYINTQINSYRTYIFEIYDTILQYMVSGVENDQAITEEIIQLGQQIKQYNDSLLQRTKSFQCLDIVFMTGFLYDLNEQRVGIDEKNESQLIKYFKLAKSIITIGVNIGTTIIGVGNIVQSLKSIIESSVEIIKNIKELGKAAGETYESAIKIKDPLLKLTMGKTNVLQYLAMLWVRKAELLTSQQDYSLEDEVNFYIEEFLELTKKKSANNLILFIMTQINYLLEKGGLGSFNNDERNQKAQIVSKKLKLNNEKMKDFISSLQQKSNQKANEYYENFKMFFKFTVVDPTYRFLANQILLKFNVLMDHQDITQDEKDDFWIHLCYTYAIEKDESVKIVFQSDTDFVERVNNMVDQNFSENSKKILQKQKIQTEDLKKNEITDKEIKENQQYILNEDSLLQQIMLNLIEQWEISARQRLQTDIAFKDDALLEVQDLYIDQNITYIEGNQIFGDNSNNFHKNAIQDIIENFFKPYIINQNKENSTKNPIILGILAEGGTGKSMLIKRLETIITKEKDTIIAKYDFLKNIIPLLIKCNGLDPTNPSIKDYLLSQGLKEADINRIKQSIKFKVIFLDGYDEYSGDYFRVYTQLQLNEWKNTLVIVTSRKEKLTQSEACIYFSLDDDNEKRDESSYTIVQLKEFERKDIDEYCKKYFLRERKNENGEVNQVQYDKDLLLMQESLDNKQLENLLFLPINLYLFTRMVNSKDELELKNLIMNIQDQIQIQEIFFKEQFNREASDFIVQIQLSQLDKKLKNEIISSYFVYFQTIAMQMFLNKNKTKQNFLQLDRDRIQFDLQESIKVLLKSEFQLKLKEKITSYVNSKIIMKVQEKEDQRYEKIQDRQIVEFKHKSLFEYFVARSMKFDFDVYGENILSLDQQKLSKFNINKKTIMNPGNNQSEQQILLKLFKLLEEDINSQSFKENYNNEDIKKTNRYMQYIRRSSINKIIDLSIIDTGASNLLSALFISKFSYPNFSLAKCSLSKAYIPFSKANTLDFDQCNLSNSYIDKTNLQAFETSSISHALFDSFRKEFESDQICTSNDIKFYKNSLITISKTGHINSFTITQNGYKLHLSKQITCSPLNKIEIMDNRLVVSTNYSLFELNPTNLEIEYSFKFNSSQIDHISTNEDKIVLALQNSQKYFGNIQSGFKNIQIKGLKPILNKQYILTVSDGLMYIYKMDKAFTLFKQITCDQISFCKFSLKGDICISISNQTFQVWNVEKGFELIHKSQNQTNEIISVEFLKNSNYLITSSNDQTCKIWNIKEGFSQLKSIQIEKGDVKLITHSTDDKYLAILYNDQSCQILDAENQFSHIDTIQGHQFQIQSIAYSQDGKYFATGSEDKTLKIWNAENGYEIIKSISSHTSIYSISFSEDVKYLASGSLDGNCIIYDVQNGFKLLKSIQAHQGKVFSTCFSKSGKYLATGSEDQTFNIWNVENDFELFKTIKGHTEEVRSIAFSQNSEFIAAGYEDGVCQIWDVKKGFELIKTIECHQGILFTLAFSADDRYLASGSWDITCKIWNVQKEFEHINTIQGHENSVCCLAFSSDGKYLATGSSDNNCKIWNVEKGFQLINTILAHTGSIKSLAFSSDNNHLATSSEDFTFKIWNIEKGFEVINTIKGHTNEVRSVTFSADSKYLATCSWDQTCKIWNTEKGFQLVKTIKGHTECIFQSAFSSNKKYFATGSADQTCKIWNVEKGFELLQTISVHSNEIMSIAFSDDSKFLATGSEDQTCKIWNTENGFQFIVSLEGHIGSIYSIAFSPNGLYISTGSEDNECKIWDIQKGFQLAKTIQGHSSYIRSVSFSRNNKYLATGSDDQTIGIWDVQKNFDKVKVIEGHTGSVYSVIFNQDNKYLITCSDDKTCKIWYVEKGFELAYSFISHNQWVFTISLSPDQKYLATGSQDFTCKIWNIDKGMKLLNELQYQSGSKHQELSNDQLVRLENNQYKQNLIDQLYVL